MSPLNASSHWKKINHDNHPWPHVVVDNLIGAKALAEVQSELSAQTMQFKTNPDDPEKLRFAVLRSPFLLNYFLSEKFREFLEDISDSKLRIREQGAIQLRQMTPDSPAFPPHHDFVDQRCLVMLYYLSPGWHPGCGGELLLQKEENADAASDQSKAIEPRENRLVLFFSDPTYWHQVKRVHNWNRYLVFAEWIVQSNSCEA